MTKIFFLVPYPLKESPSQRFRFEQYFDILHQNGYSYRVRSFFSHSAWERLYQPQNLPHKISDILAGFAKRMASLLIIWRYNFVFIHREATPLGPPILEWFIAKILRKKIIYDFDDAIWISDQLNESIIFKTLKWRKKVKSICNWAHKVSCGNEYLCEYARQFNKHVILNPTTINTETVHNPVTIQKLQSEKITIGWTGSHSTLKYLDPLQPVFEKLERKYPNVQILVIADRKPDFTIQSLRFVPWNKSTEIEDLSLMDIGVMPLPNDAWSKGKCGFKALQYMSLGIPPIVSPVGVNIQIVENGINGFIANSSEDWFSHLCMLIENEGLRTSMGKAGRKKIIESYSVKFNASNFLSLFE